MNVVPRSTTRHNIHMFPYFLFAAIHHLKSSPAFSERPCSSVGRVTVDLIRRSWVRLRSKDFIFASRGSLFPFTRANAHWVIHGFIKWHVNLHFRVNSLFHYLGSQITEPISTRKVFFRWLPGEISPRNLQSTLSVSHCALKNIFGCLFFS